MRILIDFEMDGYDSEDAHDAACLQYLDDQLNSAGTTVKVIRIFKEITPMSSEKLLITIPVNWIRGKQGGKAHLTLADCTVDVDNANGKCVGRIAGCVGGGIELKNEEVSPGNTWFVSYKDLWDAFLSALVKVEK